MDLHVFGVELIELIITVLLGLVAFIGIRIFKHIDKLAETIKEFQRDIDQRIDQFRRDFDARCDKVYSRVNNQGERLARLETLQQLNNKNEGG